MAGRGRVPGRSVAGKLFAVLDALAAADGELGLSGLARASDLPVSTTARLAGELVRWGGLERTSQGRYRVGIRLWEVASRAPSSQGVRELAMPALQDLYEVTREHVQLAVPDAGAALIVEKISHPAAVGTVGRVGGRYPLHASAVGKALAAFAEPAAQEELLAGPLVRFTAATITEPARLRAELAHVRQLGFAVSDEELSEGAVSCAAPVLGGRGTVVAAVGVVVPAGPAPASAWAGAVRTAALGIARAVAVRGPRSPTGTPRPAASHPGR